MSEKKHSRKSFLRTVGLVSFGTVLANDVVYAKNISPDMARWMQEGNDLSSMGKSSKLTIMNDRPWNIETPAHLLDDAVTPASKMFVRNNGIPPAKVDMDNWTLTIEGESASRDYYCDFQYYYDDSATTVYVWTIPNVYGGDFIN